MLLLGGAVPIPAVQCLWRVQGAYLGIPELPGHRVLTTDPPGPDGLGAQGRTTRCAASTCLVSSAMGVARPVARSTHTSTAAELRMVSPCASTEAARVIEEVPNLTSPVSVSYTHLTLPTKRIV